MTTIDPTALLALADAYNYHPGPATQNALAEAAADALPALVAAYVEHQGCAEALAADRERRAAAVEANLSDDDGWNAAMRHAARIIREHP